MPGTQHVFDGQLCGLIHALGSHLPGHAACLVTIWYWRHRHAGLAAASPHETTLTRQSKQLLFLESFFGNFLFTLCMISGVAMTSAVTAGVTMAAIPAAVAIMSWLFLRETIDQRTLAAIVFAVAGIGLNSLGKGDESSLASHPQQALGQLLLIAAVLCGAAYAVIGQKLTASISPKRITTLINL